MLMTNDTSASSSRGHPLKCENLASFPSGAAVASRRQHPSATRDEESRIRTPPAFLRPSFFPPQQRGHQLETSPGRICRAFSPPLPHWLAFCLAPKLVAPSGTRSTGRGVPPGQHSDCLLPTSLLPAAQNLGKNNLNLSSADQCEIQQWVSSAPHPQEGALGSRGRRQTNYHVGKYNFAFWSSPSCKTTA